MSKKKKIEPPDIPYPIALVIWEDSHTTDEDTVDPKIFDSDEKRMFYMAHVAWVMKDDELGVTIAYCYRYDGNVERDVSIPRSAIRYMEYLK